ncbi:MAG TPA: glycosyltransferase family 4 protein [Candidatus Cloacimonadota bacterium]|nr:glycosyltransferase family 4 protein [Candidatus Cloacimonadota bacterium]
MKKLLLISAYDSDFVKTDVEILRKHFSLDKLIRKKRQKNLLDFLVLALLIYWKAGKTDLIYCWFADSTAFLAVKAAKLFHKKICVNVGGYEVANEENYGGMKSRSAGRIKYVLNNADQIITVSGFSAEEIIKLGVQPEVVSLGIIPEQRRFPKQKIILTVGSAIDEIYRIKGLDLFAEATGYFPKYQSMIIGKFEEKIKNKLLEINPDLIFCGQITHEAVIKNMQKAEVYCQFSKRESFGYALLEAMNGGCKTVISDAGALPEIGGKGAVIVKEYTAEACAEGIRQALENPQPDQRNWIQKNYSVQRRENALTAILDSLE